MLKARSEAAMPCVTTSTSRAMGREDRASCECHLYMAVVGICFATAVLLVVAVVIKRV